MAPGLRRKIYELLMVNNAVPMTSGEIAQALPEHQINSVSTRLSEMRKLGLVKECPVRPCKVTGHNVLTYEAAIPIQPGMAPSVRQRRSRKDIERIIEKLQPVKTQKADGMLQALNWVLCHHHIDLHQLASFDA